MTVRPARMVLLGSVIGDLLFRVPALPSRGGDLLGEADALQAGGGFNVIAAAGRLGMPTALLGLVGTGPIGTILDEALRREGTELLLPRADGDTGLCIGFVEPDGERTFVTSTGVEATLRADDLRDVELRPDDVVYLSGYDLVYPVSGASIADWIDARQPTVVFDPGPLVSDIPAHRLAAVLPHTSILTLNARELQLVTGIDDPDEAIHLVLPMVREGAYVIARDGRKGCRVATGGLVERVPAPEVTAVDTTGAGDAHTGALLAALHEGRDIVDAAARANAAAALSVTRPGSATGPTPEELSAFLHS